MSDPARGQSWETQPTPQGGYSFFGTDWSLDHTREAGKRPGQGCHLRNVHVGRVLKHPVEKVGLHLFIVCMMTSLQYGQASRSSPMNPRPLPKTCCLGPELREVVVRLHNHMLECPHKPRTEATAPLNIEPSAPASPPASSAAVTSSHPTRRGESRRKSLRLSRRKSRRHSDQTQRSSSGMDGDVVCQGQTFLDVFRKFCLSRLHRDTVRRYSKSLESYFRSELFD